MKNTAYEPRADAVLVDLGERHALIDPQSERIHILNQGAAWIWQHLEARIETANANDADVLDDFLGFLNAEGLIQECARPVGQATVRLPMAPVVHGTEPLEVAANNSNGDWAEF